jgi:hypothetical protein
VLFALRCAVTCDLRAAVLTRCDVCFNVQCWVVTFMLSLRNPLRNTAKLVYVFIDGSPPSL